MINNHRLEYVNKFTYLGSITSLQGGAAEDIKTRLGKARSAFPNLQLLWRSSVYSQKTKFRIYQSNVLSVLLYGSVCWCMTQQGTNRLSSLHNTCLRKILKVYWPETISNARLHQATKQQHTCVNLKKEKVGMAWSCLQDEQRPPSINSAKLDAKRKQKMRQADNNVATNNGRRTEGCCVSMGHSSKESPRQREPKAAGLKWGTAARRAQDRGV